MTHIVTLGVELTVRTGQFEQDSSWLEGLRAELAKWADAQMDTGRACDVALIWEVKRDVAPAP